jgi:hypothetical protein
VKDKEQFAHMGMAALMPGMQYMVDLMQQQVNQLRDLLAEVQTAERKPRTKRSPEITAHKPARGSSLPEMIDGMYTSRGALAYLGMSSYTFSKLSSARKISSKTVKHPNAKTLIKIYPKSALDQLRQAAQKKMHPSNPLHPRHAAWSKKMAIARKAAAARKAAGAETPEEAAA